MGIPTGDIVSITSDTYRTKGNHLISIAIRIADKDGVFDGAYSFTIKSVDSFKISFDEAEDAKEINDLYVNVGSFGFTFYDRLSGGQSFLEMLPALEFDDLVEIRFTYDNSTDCFLCQSGDFEHNRVERTVKCKAYSPLKYGSQYNATQISPYDPDDLSTPVEYDNGTSVDNYTFITYRDLVRAVMRTINPDVIRIQSRYELVKADLSPSVFQATDEALGYGYVLQSNGNLILENGGNFVVDQYNTARARMTEGAIAEGAIFGNLFGEAFYVRRDFGNDQDDVQQAEYVTSLNSSDFEDFRPIINPPDVGEISLSIQGTSALSEEVIRDTSDVKINVTIPEYGIDCNLIARSPTGSGVDLEEESDGGEIPYQTVTDNALAIYKKALSAVDSVQWEGVILGCRNLKPYQFMSLATDVSPLLNVDNNELRPKELDYRFEEDKIYFTAYSI